MAQSITNAFVTLFDAEVKQAYQSESSLLSCVRLRQGVTGQTYKFPKLGKGTATARIPQTDVTPLGNIKRGYVSLWYSGCRCTFP